MKNTAQEALAQTAYDSIRRKMFFNEIAPGQKIYYHDLAKELNMSPTPVIQALKWLESQGLVRHENNRGFFLEPASKDEIKEIYWLRGILEVELLKKGFDQLTDADIEKIGKSLGNYEEAIQSDYRKSQSIAAREFHLTLASFAKQPIAQAFLNRLFDLIYLKYQVDISFSRSYGQGMKSHREIYELLKARDCEGACNALIADIENVCEQVIDTMTKDSEEKESLVV